MARTTWGPLSTDEQNSIEFAQVGEPGVLVAGTAGGLLKRNADGTIGNSILSESGSLLTLLGRLAINGGTVTASTPVLDLSQTWNNGAVTFTGLKLNIPTSTFASASLLLDLQHAGVSQLSVNTAGSVFVTGSYRVRSNTGYFSLGSGDDVLLQRGAANTLDLRSGANAQTWQVYGTADAGLLNYRRIRTTMTTGGAATIAAEGLGTGGSGNLLAFSIDGMTVCNFTTSTAAFNGNVQAASTASLMCASRGRLFSPADGQFLMVNNASTDADFFLKFGVNTSAAAGIKRVGTALQARLNDDSDWAGFQSRYHRVSSGSPEGVVTAPVGALFSRIDGGAGTTLYVKESGSGNTGWVAK